MLSATEHLAIHKLAYDSFKIHVKFRKNFETALFFNRTGIKRLFHALLATPTYGKGCTSVAYMMKKHLSQPEKPGAAHDSPNKRAATSASEGISASSSGWASKKPIRTLLLFPDSRVYAPLFARGANCAVSLLMLPAGSETASTASPCCNG